MRELRGGETHTYSVVLLRGQYVEVDVEQCGIDVVLSLSRPDGKKVADVDGVRETRGHESLAWVADAPGPFRLEVRSVSKNATEGWYEAKVAALREPGHGDLERIVAQAVLVEGDALRAQGKREALREAFQKYARALFLWNSLDDWRGIAEALNRLGRSSYLLGDQVSALEYFNQSLTFALGQGDWVVESDTRNFMGFVYLTVNEPQRALDTFRRTQALCEEAGDRAGLAAVASNIGVAENMLGNKRKALTSYLSALELVRGSGNVATEAAAYNHIATLYEDLGEMQKALDALEGALVIRKVQGEARRLGMVLNDIGRVYQRMGDTDRALDFLKQALPLRREAGDQAGEATTLNTLATVYLARRDPALALAHLTEAVSVSHAAGNLVPATLWLNAADSYASLGDSRKADELFSEALEAFRSSGDRVGEARALAGLGKSAVNRNDPVVARALLNDALERSRETADSRTEISSLFQLARLDLRQDDLAAAEISTKRAVERLETVRGSVASSALRASYLASSDEILRSYVEVLMARHRAEPSASFEKRALEVSEGSRGRSLRELLLEGNVDVRTGADSGLAARERELRELLAAKMERRMRLASSKEAREQASQTDREIGKLSAEYDLVRGRLRAESPNYAALTQPLRLSLAEIQGELDSETLLLEYELGEERSFLWAVTPTAVASYELEKRSEIESAARRFFERLAAPKAPASPSKRSRADREKAAATLSAYLLSPVEAQLGQKRLLIVADGALQYVPFGALPDPAQIKGHTVPLIARHEVLTLPAASLLAALRREVAGRAQPPGLVAVLADPVFEPDDQRVGSGALAASGKVWRPEEAGNRAAYRSAPEVGLATNATNRIPRLVYSRREAESILRLVPVNRSFRALDFEASRETALSPNLGRYRLVHFATHGFLNSTRPGLSGIVFSLVDSAGREVPGYLSAADTYNMKLPVDLVVLSGCQTALGREVSWEGLDGLARGFMYAGAKAVLASLWRIDDAATAEFMRRFYSAVLRDGLTPAAALQRVQNEMRQSTLWGDPVYWAAFVLQGDWRTSIPR